MGTKALILAAGFGTRLKPLTDQLPKALLPFFGPTLLDYAIRRVRVAGVQEIAVNAHHLGDLIKSHLDRAEYRDIKLSYEQEILGTGGAVNPLRAWIGTDDLLIFNADIVSDIDLSALLEHHRKSLAAATMLLLPTVLPGKNPVFATDDQVTGVGLATPAKKQDVRGTARTFACAHVLSPKFLSTIAPVGFVDIIPVYKAQLAAGARIGAAFHPGFWRDLGTPAEFWEAYATVFTDFARYDHQLGMSELSRRLRIDDDATMIDSLVYVGSGSAVGHGTHLDHAVVLPGTKVAPGQSLSYVLIGANSMIKLSKQD